MEHSARIDVIEDLEELAYLYESYAKKLKVFQKSFSKIKTNPAYRYIKDETEKHLDYLLNETQKIDQLIKSKRDANYLQQQKIILFENLRARVSIIAALITTTDWQSPSFTHSLYSQAGIQEGSIEANINDYKRDRHLNEIEYQKEFVKEYVDALIKFPINAFLTNSGMAALTTILNYLLINHKVSGPLFVGKSVYFENLVLIKDLFKDKKVIEVNEMDTTGILDLYDKKQPDFLIFDSLCNANTIAVPDILKILKYVSKHAIKETYFVIDNSTLSVALQPLKEVGLRSKVKLIVFESLNKYHQFGLDKVTAGIVWFRGFSMNDFYYSRVHSGTNITDSSCYILPTPNRKFLQKRLSRFERNTNLLSRGLSDYLKESSSNKIASVIYPGLENHPSFLWTQKYSFHGSYFVIEFQNKYQTVKNYQQFIKLILQIAKRKKINIVGGTSFGFNTTRIYLTAKDTKYGKPFIRVSVGTENRIEIETLKDVFIEAIQSF